MTVRLQAMKLKDLLAVAQLLPADERDVFARMTGEPFDADTAAARYFLVPGYKWVFDVPARPIAAGGLIPQGDGVYRTWFMALDAAWIEHGRELTTLVRSVIRDALDNNLARRIETVTLAERSRARAWYEKIGLKFESALPGDAVLYVAERG